LAHEAFQKENDSDALFVMPIGPGTAGSKYLQEAVRTGEAKFPQEMGTHYFSAVQAAIDEDWAKAEPKYCAPASWA